MVLALGVWSNYFSTRIIPGHFVQILYNFFCNKNPILKHMVTGHFPDVPLDCATGIRWDNRKLNIVSAFLKKLKSYLFRKFISNRWVYTGLSKRTWSAFEVHLRLSCVWTDPFSLDWSWLVVLSCHRNFKTSKCRSALTSKVKTCLETAPIQSQRRMFIIKVSIISSKAFHSRKRLASDKWLMNDDNTDLQEMQVGFSQFKFMS